MGYEANTIMCSRNGETWYIRTFISDKDFGDLFDTLVDYDFKDIKPCDNTVYWAQKTHQWYVEKKDLPALYEEITEKNQYQPKTN